MRLYLGESSLLYVELLCRRVDGERVVVRIFESLRREQRGRLGVSVQEMRLREQSGRPTL